ncbi:fimbrial protein [Paraburkholderia fungorum]|uniref:fimbrial protein n=1 Tax=Paraburkholderia fungorum TaxID=134537 RepID=UPI0038BC1F4E
MKILFKIFRVNARFCALSDPAGSTWTRHILTILACVLGMCATIPANAACSFKSGGVSTANQSFGNVSVSTNAPVGTVLASFGNRLFGTQEFWCGSSVPTTLSFMMSGTGSSGLYETNIPGIGIRIRATSGGYGMPQTYMPISWSYTISMAGYGFAFNNQIFSIQLVKTGPIDLSGGNALSYNVSPWLTIQPTDGSASPFSVADLSVTATITSRSCSVTTSSVSVTLPTAFASNLATRSTGSTPFNLSLDCAAGTKVYATLTDASNVSNTSTTLGLTPDSTAAGIGLQILNGSTPIAYGPDSAVAGTTSQWSAGTAAGGPMNIPLTVQYVRTTGALTPGTVKGAATFTMSYQ